MAAQRDMSDNDDKWLAKMNLMQEQHEQIAQSIGESNNELRRGLTITSLLAEGQSESVDEALKGLRGALRSDDDSIKPHLNVLEKILHTFGNQCEIQATGLSEKIAIMGTQLADLPMPEMLHNKVRTLRKSAPKDLQTWAGYSRQLNGWASVLQNIAKLNTEVEAESQSSSAESSKNANTWWKRKNRIDPSTSNEQTQVASELTKNNITSNVSGHNELSPSELETMSNDIAETLVGLITRLIIPERLESRAGTLYQRLSDCSKPHEIAPLLEDTSQFLLECLGNGQQEFEKFLLSLDKRLGAIQFMVSDANQGQNEREKARLDLDAMVRDQIDDIRSVVHGLGDLGELGTSVKDHLTTIVQAMEHYQKLESEREIRLADQLQALQARLSEMEAEASQARKIIEAQKQQATQDHLTGLPNRAAYQVRLDEELLNRSRSGTSLAMIMCDVDHFKKINDTFGHLTGDKVLQLLAKVIRKSLRPHDFVARYGGEEFVVLLPQTSSQEALAIAEKARAKIESATIKYKGELIPITMSFGISEFRPLEAPETVFNRADEALYAAKGAGRNQCIVA
ncbi:MAG: GGDEF domain-containing protein [Oleibacter sp.]|nr:GGDEF domain-containing protein [Thalassolituus sp.]